MRERFLDQFSIFELILLTFMAAAGVAVKPIVVSISHLITGPLLIPGGAFAGGLYMMFVILGAGLVGKRGSATLICLIQAMLVIVTGIYGSHGIASLVTYILPGLCVDLLWLAMRHKGCCLWCCFFGGMIANTSGVFLVNLVFFRLPTIPLLLSLAMAVLSGGIGGLIAWYLIKALRKQKVLPSFLVLVLAFCLVGCSPVTEQPQDQVKAKESMTNTQTKETDQIKDQEKEKGLHNSQTYQDAIAGLKEKKRVLVILMDGFGYGQYETAMKQGNADYLATLPKARKARTYMPSISPVGLAAMVTGKGPEENGIKKRGDTELLVPDLFQKAQDLGKKVVYIEGDINMIGTALKPMLNIDLDGDGLTDNEVFETAQKQLDINPELILVHFHGIDDVSHLYGPKSKEAGERTKIIDEYIRRLAQSFDGTVIITADHGQHLDLDGTGTHGTERESDMVVPYIVKEN